MIRSSRRGPTTFAWILLLLFLLMSNVATSNEESTTTTRDNKNNKNNRWSFGYFPSYANFSAVAVDYFALTHVVDVSAKLLASADGTVTAPAGAGQWPNPEAVASARSEGKGLGVSLSGVDKDAQDALVADPAARATLVAQVSQLLRSSDSPYAAANVTQLMVDFEGLASSEACRDGFSALVAELVEELGGGDNGVEVVPTIWAAKLYQESPALSAYDAGALCGATNAAVLIMGYDLQPLDLPSGVSGWEVASANAPMPNLVDALNHTVIGLGCDPQKLVLGLPWYGRLYTCDGDGGDGSGSDDGPGFPKCSCSTNNMKKKSFDLLDGLQQEPAPTIAIATAATTAATAATTATTTAADAAATAVCSFGYDEASVSRVVECPAGSGLPGSAHHDRDHDHDHDHERQQAWYDDAVTLAAKYDLAAAWGLRGVGVWTVASADDSDALAPTPQGTFPRDGDMWQALRNYSSSSSSSSSIVGASTASTAKQQQQQQQQQQQ